MMTNTNDILRKTYVAPLLSFEEIEEEQALLAGTTTQGGGPKVDTDPKDPDPWGSDAKEGTTDFVFELPEELE